MIKNIIVKELNVFGLHVSLSREQKGCQKEQTQTQKTGADWLQKAINVTSMEKAMKVSAFWRCVNLISDSIAIMPLRYMRKTQEGVFAEWVKNDVDHLNRRLNVNPNARQNGFVFKKNIVMQMLLQGNAIVVPVNERGYAVDFERENVKSLVLLRTLPTYDMTRNEYTFSDAQQGIPYQRASARKVWHFRNPSYDGGFWGLSTISQARTTLSITATAENETLERFATGGRFKAILGYDQGSEGKQWGTHSQQQMKGAAIDVESELKKHDIVVMPDKGLDLKTLNMSSQDLQFLENKKFALADIARWFGIPLIKLGESTSNYKSVDASQVSFFTEALQPICSQIENELLAKTTTDVDLDTIKFDFDETPLFSLDMEGRAKWMKAQMEMGLQSVNDLRKQMDIAPIEDGDTVLMSANLKAIGLLKKEGQSEATGGGVKPENDENNT